MTKPSPLKAFAGVLVDVVVARAANQEDVFWVNGGPLSASLKNLMGVNGEAGACRRSGLALLAAFVDEPFQELPTGCRF